MTDRQRRDIVELAKMLFAEGNEDAITAAENFTESLKLKGYYNKDIAEEACKDACNQIIGEMWAARLGMT